MTRLRRAATVVLVTLVMSRFATSLGEVEPQHYKIGLLTPWTGFVINFYANTSASAVGLAVKNIHSDPVLGPNMRLT